MGCNATRRVREARRTSVGGGKGARRCRGRGALGQTAFALARKSGLLAGMGGAERLALFLAALCHDIEHPGVSASFLLRSGSNMAAWCARCPLLLMIRLLFCLL